MPLYVLHCDVNCPSVRAPTVVEVTVGFGETPPSQAVAGIGVSPYAVSVLAAPALALAPDAPQAADAKDRRPLSAAESSAWLAPEPVSTVSDTRLTIPRGRAGPRRQRSDPAG